MIISESEPTDYKDLEQLRKYYQPICAQPYFIDYGCGQAGRYILFIISISCPFALKLIQIL